jgi:hypothetical protein
MNESELDACIRPGRAGGNEDTSVADSPLVPPVGAACLSRFGFLVGYGWVGAATVLAGELVAVAGGCGVSVSVGAEVRSGATRASAPAASGVAGARIAARVSSGLRLSPVDPAGCCTSPMGAGASARGAGPTCAGWVLASAAAGSGDAGISFPRAGDGVVAGLAASERPRSAGSGGRSSAPDDAVSGADAVADGLAEVSGVAGVATGRPRLGGNSGGSLTPSVAVGVAITFAVGGFAGVFSTAPGAVAGVASSLSL